MQDSASSPPLPNFPGGQAVQALLLEADEYAPAGQVVQAVLATPAEYSPAPHVEQAAAPAPEYSPGPQAPVHAAAVLPPVP